MIRAATQEEIFEIGKKIPYYPSIEVNGIVLTENSEVKILVIYDYWTKTCCQMHVWSSSPKYSRNPIFIREVFWYPFVFANRNLLVTITPGDNKASLRLSNAMGFRETFRLKDGWDIGVDMILKEMHRDECRWLQKEAA